MSLQPFSYLSPGQIGPVKAVCEGVFSAEAVAPTGEKVYFGIESLERFDREKWDCYRNTSILLVLGGLCDFTIGSFAEIGSHLHDEQALKAFLATRKMPDFWTSNPQKFEELCRKVRTRKIALGTPRGIELSVIPQASYGMKIETQTHIAYASKIPVTGRINLRTQYSHYQDIAEMYGDLIMSVGVKITDVVENRGIFRNPLSIVEGGFGSLAIMMHRFTCLVVKDNFPAVTTFEVRPLTKMGELFFNALPKHLITINGIQGDLYEGGFEKEKSVQVPVAVLASLHHI